MSPSTRYTKKHTKARQHCHLHAHDRLERARRPVQRAIEALAQTLHGLGWPEHLVQEIKGRLRSPHQLLGKILGVRFLVLFGCRTPSALCRVRG
jgi:hypothetical protein